MRFIKSGLIIENLNPAFDKLYLKQGWVPAIGSNENKNIEVKDKPDIVNEVSTDILMDAINPEKTNVLMDTVNSGSNVVSGKEKVADIFQIKPKGATQTRGPYKKHN